MDNFYTFDDFIAMGGVVKIQQFTEIWGMNARSGQMLWGPIRVKNGDPILVTEEAVLLRKMSEMLDNEISCTLDGKEWLIILETTLDETAEPPIRIKFAGPPDI